MCHPMRAAAALAVALAVLAAAASPAVAAEAAPPRHRPPVDAPVVDPFRLPSHPFGPGNRGIDYGAPPGTVVRASAPGVVSFAGRIGAHHHVVVLHPDGLRTSYSFLAGVAVRRGQQVDGGDVVGTAGGPLHFGARRGDTYIDPRTLFGGRWVVHLVPAGEVRPGTVSEERRGLLRSLGGAAIGALGAGADWVRAASGATAGAVTVLARRALVEAALQWRSVVGDVRAMAHLARGAMPVHRLLRVARAMQRWSQAPCTPASVTPPRPPERRIALLVGGLGSSSEHAAVLQVDTAALGYAADDVVQFSYRGGVAPGRGALVGVPVRTYAAGDTEVDLRRSAAELTRTLEAIRHHHPGVPVDVIAHSQGGVVARLALGTDAGHLDPRRPVIRTLVTLGSPHQGADVATAVDALDGSAVGTGALGVADVAGAPLGPSTLQLSETSSLVDELAGRPLPAGTHVTSVGAVGDLVVAAPNTALDGAHHVLVDLVGPSAHAALPAHPAAQRELALAVAGLAPTCRSFLHAAHQAAFGEMVSMSGDALGLGLAVGSRYLDRNAPSPRTRR